MKRIGAVVGLCIVAVLCGWLAYNGGTYTVVLTTDDVQQRINTAVAKREQKTINVESVQVSFANNLMYLNTEVSGKLHTRLVKTAVHAVGVPEYRNGAFYFHSTSIRFDNIEVSKPEVESFALTRKLLADKVQQFATQEGMQDITDAFKTEFREWIVIRAEAVITNVLTHYPVYTLKDNYKGIAVQATLDNVAIVDDTLHVTVSIIKLGYTIFISAVSLVIAIGIIATLLVG